MSLQTGEPAPDFEAVDNSGTRRTLHEYRGAWVVLYFYPRAFTPLCTQETRAFGAAYDELRALGACVLGVSNDDVRTQMAFAERCSVRFPLLADADGTIARAYGAARKLLPFTKRLTYVVDPEGVVRAVLHHELRVNEHVERVRALLKEARRS